MKRLRKWLVSSLLAAGQLATQAETVAPTEAGPGSTNTPAPVEMAAANAATNGVRLNFRNAPLNLVLDYLADAAGFTINRTTEVHGTVEVFAKETVSRDEAVTLLNAALRKNGYALLRQGQTLSLVRRDSASQADLEVVSGSDPEAVSKSDEMVTQIIPIRYAAASQIMNNLQVLLPASTTLSVNESANSLILVATKTEIRRVLRIVQAIDVSLARVSAIHVFAVRYADAKQLATLVQQIFSSQGSSQGGSAQGQFANLGGGPGGMGSGQGMGGLGGGGGPPGGFGGMGAAAGGSAGGSSTSAGAKVVAVADEYSNSLIVSSPPGMVASISNVVQQIDLPVTDVTEVRAFHLINADPEELAEQIAQLFPDSSSSSSAQDQSPFRFGGPPGAFGGGPGGGPGDNSANSATGTSDRNKKKGRVLAVADRRSGSLLVSASGTLMPHIAKMIAELDASPARREQVQVHTLRNASPQQVSQVLQDLFNRNTAMRSSSRTSQQDNDPLMARETEQQQQTTSSFGNSGGSGGSGGGATGGGQ